MLRRNDFLGAGVEATELPLISRREVLHQREGILDVLVHDVGQSRQRERPGVSAQRRDEGIEDLFRRPYFHPQGVDSIVVLGDWTLLGTRR